MEKKIVSCNIEECGYMNVISVVYDDGSKEGFGQYYPDELYYSEDEFIGLTKRQAEQLMRDKDVAYLRR